MNAHLTIDPDQFDRNRKYRFDLAVSKGSQVRLPVLMARGCAPGKTLVVTAGVHGDELEGIRAVYECFEALDVSQMSGNLLAVPVANPPAFWNRSRKSPLDGENLARAFPGDPQGTVTQAIAYSLAYSIIRLADFYLDLHSSSAMNLMPSMVGYSCDDSLSREAAEIFGAEITWGHPTIGPGRTISFASAQRIPWLYTEARGGGRIELNDLEMMKRGIRNLLAYLDIVPREPEVRTVRYRLYGRADTDAADVCAKRCGFLISEVSLLQKVSEGERLGRLIDLHGQELETYHSPTGGRLALVREFATVRSGDPLYLVAQTLGELSLD